MESEGWAMNSFYIELTHMYVKQLERFILFVKVLEKSENYWFGFFLQPQIESLIHCR